MVSVKKKCHNHNLRKVNGAKNAMQEFYSLHGIFDFMQKIKMEICLASSFYRKLYVVKSNKRAHDEMLGNSRMEVEK